MTNMYLKEKQRHVGETCGPPWPGVRLLLYPKPLKGTKLGEAATAKDKPSGAKSATFHNSSSGQTQGV